jgi:uncharacterized protein (TIGR02147 family)
MEFNFFADYFRFQVNLNQSDSERPNHTLKELAYRVGYNSPSILSMVASGERLPSDALLEALLKEWKIPTNEAAIIKLKVAIEKKSKKNKDHFELQKELNKLQQKIGYSQTSVEEFEMMSEWYILVLRSLIGTKIFNEDPSEISVILRRKVSPAKIKSGIEVLLKLGLIKKNLQTGLLEQNQQNIESSHNIPSAAIKNHHREMINRALEAVDEQDVNERTLNGLTLNFEIERYREAQEKILTFIKSFNEEFGQNNSESIYQLNLQFFAHTNGKKINKEFYERQIH